MVLAVADVVVYKGVRYETKTAHTTGATFDYSKFIRAASNSLLGKGFCVPAGSLDTALTDLALHGSKLVEWVGFGDSLMNGQVNGGNVYSWWANRVRERLVTGLGITDGGRGYNWTGAATSGIDNFGTEPTPVSAVTGFAANDLFGIAGMAISATANDAITFKAVGTRCRLWWSRFSQGGRFSYTVNGGAAVTVNSGYNDAPQIPAASGQSWSPDNSVLLTSADGLTSGTNTIVVTNLGGALTTAPVMTAVNNATGTLPAATYYYVATTVTSNGETTPGNAMSRVTSANQGNNTVFAIGQGGLTVRIYRSTTGAAGSYQLIGSTTGNSNGVWGFTDNGSATPGAAPPTVDTSGLDNLNKTVHVTVEPINATGLVLHNQGVSGTDTYTLFDVNAQDNNIPALALMGLQWGTGANGLAQYLPSEQLPSANNSGTDTPLVRSKARKPSLVVFAFGTNDIQHADNSLVTAPNAPSATDGGVGVGSGLAAATYYYKVARVVPNQFGGYGPISAASSGTAVTAGHQALVTMPSPGNSPGAAIWAVFRSTSSGGTYAYVGESVGHGSVFIDNITTPGAAYGATGLVQPTVDTSRTENALALGIRMARNAGADVLVVLPSIESLQNSRHIGAIYKAAILRVAQSYSCAWVDWDIALGPQAARGAAGYGGGSANPHLTKAAYQAQGDFLVDNILLPLYQTA